MTPEPTENPNPQDVQLDVQFYVEALEQKNAQLLRENTVLTAVVSQVQKERDKAFKALEEAASEADAKIVQHEGRVTRTKPKTRKRTANVQEA